MKKENKKDSGFTLIEFIVYTGIISLILVIASGFAWNIIQSNIKATSFREVQQNGRLAMEKITKELRSGTNTNAFTVNNETLYYNSNPITTDEVEIINFNITPVGNSYKISFDIQYENTSGRNEYDAIISLESAIMPRQ